jgi:hypothetical protein
MDIPEPSRASEVAADLVSVQSLEFAIILESTTYMFAGISAGRDGYGCLRVEELEDPLPGVPRPAGQDRHQLLGIAGSSEIDRPLNF